MGRGSSSGSKTMLNMANLQYEGTAIRVVTHPKLLKWDGMKWEANRPVNTRPLNTIEARIPQA